MSEIVAIGQKDQIIGFRGVGVQIAPVKTAEEFAAAFKETARRADVGIIMITETFVEGENEKLLASVRKTTQKVILVLPDHPGSKGLAFKRMRADVERALGVDLLGKSGL